MSADTAAPPPGVGWRSAGRRHGRCSERLADRDKRGGDVEAVVCDGPLHVTVKDVPDARIERPIDVLVRSTTTNNCGSDLHPNEGRTDFEPGRWFGHENRG